MVSYQFFSIWFHCNQNIELFSVTILLECYGQTRRSSETRLIVIVELVVLPIVQVAWHCLLYNPLFSCLELYQTLSSWAEMFYVRCLAQTVFILFIFCLFLISAKMALLFPGMWVRKIYHFVHIKIFLRLFL